MDQNDFASLQYKVDAIAGAQHALTCALSFLMAQYRGNQEATPALQDGLEQIRSSLLASLASDYSIGAFDETATALLELLKAQP